MQTYYVLDSHCDSNAFEIAKCNSLETKKETRECLHAIEKQKESDDLIVGNFWIVMLSIFCIYLFIKLFVWIDRM